MYDSFLNVSLSAGVMPVLLVFFCSVRSQVLDAENQAYNTSEEIFYKQPSL